LATFGIHRVEIMALIPAVLFSWFTPVHPGKYHDIILNYTTSVLATGITGYSVAGSNPTEGGGFLWVIKVVYE
jgi:hypothetical protein